MSLKEVPGKHIIKDLERANLSNITLDEQNYTLVERIAVILSYLIFVLTFPIAVFLSFVQVEQYERGVKFRLGHLLKGQYGPGLCFVLPCVDTMKVIDLRILSMRVPPQEALTKDAVSVQVDAAIFYCVLDPIKAVNNIEDYRGSTLLLATTTLRNVIGAHNLTEVLTNREEISLAILHILESATAFWGVDVERVEIKDVSLPINMQRAMAAEAEATREARAKVIAAEGEMKASKSLKLASDIVDESPSALQLRYLQALQSIAAEKNSTIIFPFPLDLTGAFSMKR